MTLTDKELAEIAERVKLTPGTWHEDCCGAPVVCLGYAEKLINMLPKTQLYLRAKRNEKFEDEMAKFVQLAEQLKPLFAPAYQAHRDVAVLLEEVKRYKQLCLDAQTVLQRAHEMFEDVYDRGMDRLSQPMGEIQTCMAVVLEVAQKLEP